MSEHLEARVSRHEEVHETFDRRISRNEEWRLQIQGALKFAAFAVGSGGALTLVLVLFGVV